MNGCLQDTLDGINQAFVNYYTKLLGGSNMVTAVHKGTVQRGNVLTEVHHEVLNRPVTGKEIKDAMFDIPNDKAPGPDGYTSKFYKDAWPRIEIGGSPLSTLIHLMYGVFEPDLVQSPSDAWF